MNTKESEAIISYLQEVLDEVRYITHFQHLDESETNKQIYDTLEASTVELEKSTITLKFEWTDTVIPAKLHYPSNP